MKSDFPTKQTLDNYFVILREHFGTHRAAAEYLGVSYSRYNEWRWGRDPIPKKFRRLLELAVQGVQEMQQGQPAA